MSRVGSVRFLFPLLLALAVLCPGCSRAQVPATQKELDRRIEVLVRSQMNIPPAYQLAIGQRTKSEFAGYDTLAITFSHNEARRTVNFLISADNRTLLRMDKFDLSKDPALTVSYKDRPFRGGADAKVTIVNFDDLECPFCSRMHHELFPETLARYGDKVKIVYKDFPLVEMHPWALHAAVDANCLAQQNVDAYWAYVDQAHDHSEEITGPKENRSQSGWDDKLDKMAVEVGAAHKVDQAALHTCLVAQDTSRIRASMAEGEDLGIDATPTLFINGEKVSGADGTDVLWPVIDRALLDAGVAPPVDKPKAPASAAPAGAQPVARPASKPEGQ